MVSKGIGRVWNSLDDTRRKFLLREYFRTDITVNKHIAKPYSKLPTGFQKHLRYRVYAALR